MEPVLVIGSRGMLGRQIAKDLRERGRHVIGSSRDGAGAEVEIDLLRPETIRRAIRETRPGAVVLSAGLASARIARENPDLAFRLNTAGTFHLLDSVSEGRPDLRLILISTAAVYGAPPAGRTALREGDPVSPTGTYGASKAAAEALFLQHGRQGGNPVTVARAFNQIGPGLATDHAPAEFARAIVEAEVERAAAVTLKLGNPAARRDFTDSRDTAAAIGDLLGSDEQGTFNVCSGTGTGLTDLIEHLAGLTDLEVRTEPRPDRAHRDDIDEITGDPSKLRRATGWKPGITLERSLADLLADMRSEAGR